LLASLARRRCWLERSGDGVRRFNPAKNDLFDVLLSASPRMTAAEQFRHARDIAQVKAESTKAAQGGLRFTGATRLSVLCGGTADRR